MASFDPKLIELLACPKPHHAPVRQEGDVIVCTECGARFAVRDGIPIMLIDQELPE